MPHVCLRHVATEMRLATHLPTYLPDTLPWPRPSSAADNRARHTEVGANWRRRCALPAGDLTPTTWQPLPSDRYQGHIRRLLRRPLLL